MISYPVILIRSKKKKILSKDNQGKSANEIKKIPLWLLCDMTSNFEDLTKFASEIHEVDTSVSDRSMARGTRSAWMRMIG